MPDTRDVRELEPDRFGKKVKDLPSAERARLLKGSLTQQVVNSLESTQKTKTGFAVQGTGLEALREAHQTLVDGKSPGDSFTGDVSVVFFSCQYGRYVQLTNISRGENQIEVQYKFISHKELEATSHFALIPLSGLKSGEYTVKFTQVGPNPVEEKQVIRTICKPFSFSIK
jgi:hypothetical protein